MTTKDLYEILDIPRDASQEDIKKAFKKKAMVLHPDKNPNNPDAADNFKKVNEAYSILSDESKKRNYDQFGTTDDSHGHGGVDINDILKNMFGGGGGMPNMHGMPGGFSFSFGGGGPDLGGGGGIPEDIFDMFSGGGFPGMPRRRGLVPDIIDVHIDINDIYYGNTKKVEFELLEKCTGCDGTGAQDPSCIIKCITCKGEGKLHQQMGPFVQIIPCHSCSGNGTMIKNNKFCTKCVGKKTIYTKKIFDLKLPKGVPNNHEVKMDKKGSYDEKSKQNKDIIFRFRYNISQPYQLDDHMNVIYTFNITIEDLLSGFLKKLKIYKEDMVIRSDRYFNPTRNIVLKNQGIFNMKKNKNSDLILHFNVEFTDSERLTKYNDIMLKVFKKEPNPEPNDEDKNVIDITKIEGLRPN